MYLGSDSRRQWKLVQLSDASVQSLSCLTEEYSATEVAFGQWKNGPDIKMNDQRTACYDSNNTADYNVTLVD